METAKKPNLAILGRICSEISLKIPYINCPPC